MPPLDAEAKAMILGGNYVRMSGIDLDGMLATHAGDEWSRARAERGLDEPFANWRALTGVAA
jgi:hypothetical protein